MASTITITSFVGGTAAGKQLLTTTPRRGVVPARASMESEKIMVKEERSSRRDMMFAVVAAAACSVAKVAMADEPKRGTSEAKKKYGPICVTMPTARICHK